MMTFLHHNTSGALFKFDCSVQRNYQRNSGIYPVPTEGHAYERQPGYI